MLQTTLDREEALRGVRLRRAIVAAPVALIIVAAAAFVMRGSPATAERAQASPVASVPSAAVARPLAPVTQPSKAASASNLAGKTPPPAPKKRARVRPIVKAPSSAKPSASTPRTQAFRIAIGTVGFVPASIRASTGSPIALSVGRGQGCAAGFLIPRLKVDKDNSTGPVTINLGRVPAGTYQYSCGMGMVTGTLIVK